MSTNRFTKPPYKGQKGRCSWCGTTDLPAGRKSWCSQECVDQYLLRSSSDHIRKAIFDRDKGICALCGCDSNAEFVKYRALRKDIARLCDRLVQSHRFNLDHIDGYWQLRKPIDLPTAAEQKKFQQDLLDKYLPSQNWTTNRTTGWDADHIIPVAEGGGECDLDNYRTLCHPCHKKVTADLAARLAKKRRPQQELPFTP